MSSLDIEKVIDAWEPCCTACGSPAAGVAEVGRQLAEKLERDGAPSVYHPEWADVYIDAANQVREWTGAE